MASLLAFGVASRVVALFAYPVLMRLYDPKAFGVLGLFSTIVSFSAIFATLRYELAIPVCPNENDAKHILLLTMLLSATCGLLVVLLVAFVMISGVLADVVVDLHGLVWLIPVAVTATGFYIALTYWAMRRSQFVAIGKTQIVKTWSEVGAQIILNLLVAGHAGLVMGNFVGSCLGIAGLARAGRPYGSVACVSRTRILNVARLYARFPLFNGSAALLNEAGGRLLVLFVAQVLGPPDLGLFWLPFMLLGSLSNVAIVAGQRVYYAHAAKIVRANASGLQRFFARCVGWAAVFAWPSCALLVWLAPFSVGTVVPSRWANAVPLFHILAPCFAAQICTVPFITYNVVGRQHLALLWNAIHFALHVLVVVIAWFMAAEIEILAALYSFAVCLSCLILFVINFRVVARD